MAVDLGQHTYWISL